MVGEPMKSAVKLIFLDALTTFIERIPVCRVTIRCAKSLNHTEETEDVVEDRVDATGREEEDSNAPISVKWCSKSADLTEAIQKAGGSQYMVDVISLAKGNTVTEN